MRMALLNFVLALVWMALRASFRPVDFIVGFVIGFGIIMLTHRAFGVTSSNYSRKSWQIVRFIGFTFWNIIKANVAVARIVLSPQMNIHPGILAVTMDSCSDVGMTSLANLITLTPGTVTLDVASDKCTLYIHFMNVDDPDALRSEIKNYFERRVVEVFE